MYWFVMLSIAIFALALTRHLQQVDDVYRLAIHSMVFSSALWGFVIAPSIAQVAIVVLAFGWLQIESSRT